MNTKSNNIKIENFLESRNVKPTAIRNMVMKYFYNKETASSLKQLEEHFDHSEMTTLYRTLNTFVENKILHTIDDGTGVKKYAKCVHGCECSVDDLHYHFHCNKCEETLCLVEKKVNTFELPLGFKMQEANMVVKGICSSCS